MHNDLVILNGKLISKSQAYLDIDNRSFRYGDGLFESIRIHQGQPMLFNYHFERVSAGIKLLQLEPDNNFNEDYLIKQILRLKAIHTGTKEARVRISLFRNGGGLYTPLNNSFSCLIELTPLAINGYPLNVTGLKTDIFVEIKKPLGILSNFKTNNALTSVLAGIYKSKSGLDEAIILNQEGRLCESISSNLFFVDNKERIITPALSEGCLAGVMRKYVMNLLKEEFEIFEAEISVKDLETYTGCFITNATRGIQWIEYIGSVKYQATEIQLLHQKFVKAIEL